MQRLKLTILSISFAHIVFSQSIINGNFENTTATSDQINLSNSAMNAMLPDVNSFGSYGDVDIIKSSAYGGGGAQDKTWYLGLTGGGTDIIAMTLTQPLVAGNTYSLSFYDRRHNGYTASPIQVGVSESNSSFGKIVYTSPQEPQLNVWTQRTFTFVAPNNGKYITVQMASGDINVWANIDNFVLNSSKKCDDILVLDASSYTINKGNAVTLTANGSANYTWTSTSAIRNTNGSVISEIPLLTTTYFVSGKVEGCSILTASTTINVIEPKKDTVMAKKEPLKFSRHKLNNRKLIIQETLHVPDATVKLQVWDKNTVDGDMVSIFLNGVLIADSVDVVSSRKEYLLNLQAGSNLIVMQAINLGSVPPNTATIGINNRNKNITIVSDLESSGAIEVFFNPETITTK
ncbi:MAG: carbohydrate binding domain-containing protein [Bacteroidota bacterium]|nr:carbohydrate binding domain-containing protein [Bacteroidota bacterium]